MQTNVWNVGQHALMSPLRCFLHHIFADDLHLVSKYLRLTTDKLSLQGRPLLWFSNGHKMLPSNISTLVSTVTQETIGVSVSPHLFRTAGASTAAIYGGGTPHLASALLDHRDPRVTEEHYNRASSMSAAQTYAAITGTFREGG